MLLTFAPCDHRHSTRFASDAEDDWFLYPGNKEMSTFSTYSLQDTSEAIEDHCPFSSINCIVKTIMELALNLRDSLPL